MSKGPGVQRMFDDIASRYDLMNRVMTLGQDQRWRRFVVQQAGDPGSGWVLDLACGTGDIAALFRETRPACKIIGADFSRNMLAEAQRRHGGRSLFFQVSDANQLPFPDRVFSVVTFGYLLRNVDDAGAVLREVCRVLKPGGTAICLDTTPPARNLFYPLIAGYLRWGVPLLGRLLARDRSAYAYLSGSTMEFYQAEDLAGLFRQSGFREVGYRKFMAGTVAVHWGTA